MRGQPFPDGEHAHLFPFQQPPIDHDPAKRDVLVPVLPVIQHRAHRPVLKAQPSRPLNLEHENVHRIFHPRQFQPAPLQRALAVDGVTGVIGALFAQIRRGFVDRVLETPLADVGRRDLRLVIAGEAEVRADANPTEVGSQHFRGLIKERKQTQQAFEPFFHLAVGHLKRRVVHGHTGRRFRPHVGKALLHRETHVLPRAHALPGRVQPPREALRLHLRNREYAGGFQRRDAHGLRHIRLDDIRPG